MTMLLAQAEMANWAGVLNLGAAGVGFATMYIMIEYIRSRDKAFTEAMALWCKALVEDSKAGREQAQAFLNAQVVVNQTLAAAVAKSAIEIALTREGCQQRAQGHPPTKGDGS